MRICSLLCLVLGSGLMTQGAELPLFGPLPSLGKTWTLREQGTNFTSLQQWSWLVFTGSLNGDVMSFAAGKLGDEMAPKVELSGAWLARAGDVFPDGNPMWVGDPGAGLVGNWMRANMVPLSVADGLLKTNIVQEALEYSIVFEDEAPANGSRPNRLAHGYALSLGELRVFVQHTSSRVITSDDAQGFASRLMVNHALQTAGRGGKRPGDKEKTAKNEEEL